MVQERRRRPDRAEYSDYYHRYVGLVPDGDIVEILRAQLGSTLELLQAIPLEKADFRYTPGKWSAKEVIGHVTDVEWIFTYRALRFARGDQTPLAGMEQDEFMSGANFDRRDLSSLTEEFHHLRTANLVLFDSFGEEILERRGTASGCDFTVRSVLYIIAGHAEHHMRVLKERYLRPFSRATAREDGSDSSRTPEG